MHLYGGDALSLSLKDIIKDRVAGCDNLRSSQPAIQQNKVSWVFRTRFSASQLLCSSSASAASFGTMLAMLAMKDRDGPLCGEENLFGDAQSETVIGHGATQALGPLGRLVT